MNRRLPGLVSALICWAALQLAWAPHVAAAQTEDAGAEEGAAEAQRFADAQRFYDNGKLAYDLGRFDDAAAQFERAYALRPAPLLLFNLAQCQRQLGDAKAAAVLYESFLRESTDGAGPQGVIAREELARLRSQLEAETARLPADAEPKIDTATPSEPAATESNDVVLWGAVGGGALLVVALGTAAIAASVLASLPAQGEAGRLDFR